jgi:hypothetical protein
MEKNKKRRKIKMVSFSMWIPCDICIDTKLDVDNKYCTWEEEIVLENLDDFRTANHFYICKECYRSIVKIYILEGLKQVKEEVKER